LPEVINNLLIAIRNLHHGYVFGAMMARPGGREVPDMQMMPIK